MEKGSKLKKLAINLEDDQRGSRMEGGTKEGRKKGQKKNNRNEHLYRKHTNVYQSGETFGHNYNFNFLSSYIIIFIIINKRNVNNIQITQLA